MDFDALVGTMDDIVTDTFQKVVDGQPLELIVHPNDGSSDFSVPCVVKNPAMEEDYVPGSANGTAMLMLFCPSYLGVVGFLGNTATYGGVDYDIVQSDADRCGGMHLRLRARMLPWDQ